MEKEKRYIGKSGQNIRIKNKYPSEVIRLVKVAREMMNEICFSCYGCDDEDGNICNYKKALEPFENQGGNRQ